MAATPGAKAPVRLALGVVLALASSSALAQGEPARGKAVFDSQCSGCHVLTGPSYAGPPLAGVVGRKAGTAPGFSYSPAMAQSGIVWDDKSLNDFLTDPARFVPGTNMFADLTDPQERDDVIAYLRSVSPSH